MRVGNLIHLGLPIGNQKHIEEFFCEKFKKVEKSFYSLSSVGCNSKGLNYFIVSNIYKKFCQSIFYYGLETNYIRKDCLKKLDLRQSILIKNIFGLSKYSKTTPLLKALNIKSIVQLYEEYKILFLKQIRMNSMTNDIYKWLLEKYKNDMKPARESYFNILIGVCNKYGIDSNRINVKIALETITNEYTVADYGLTDSIKFLISKSGSSEFDKVARNMLKLLLNVNFYT